MAVGMMTYFFQHSNLSRRSFAKTDTPSLQYSTRAETFKNFLQPGVRLDDDLQLIGLTYGVCTDSHKYTGEGG